MEMQTVFLITSAHPGWLAICEAFRTLPGFCIIGQTRSPMLAVTGIAAYRPAIVIMPVYCDPHNSSEDLYGVKLLLQLRSCSPESKILVVEERLWSTESLALTKLDIRGIVTWSELTVAGIQPCLEAGQCGLWVANPEVIRSLASGPSRPDQWLRGGPAFSDLEHGVLDGLASGQPLKVIARETDRSVSTVKRVIVELEQKLEVTNTNSLLVKAARLGLVA